MKKHFKSFFPFALRFMTVHTVTYAVCGIMFMLISGYFEYFAADPLRSMVMKPADALTVQLAVPAQFIRGFILAFAIYPFRTIILEKPIGWLKLFSMMFILTSIGAVITGPGSIEGFLYTNLSFDNPLIGTPEIIVQMLAFSWLFCSWQRKKQKASHTV
jgi:hypothetical protein